jgi:tetratricopeptide (TPR) repeat protein
VLLAVAFATGAAFAGVAEAERQYRVARRLAAEGSTEAAAAFRKVIELDPDGPLVDDAMLDEALLQPLARWPEDLGGIDGTRARRALGILKRILEDVPDGNRVPEARYYAALLRLEPLMTHNRTEARFDLVTVATDPAETEWTLASRYALGWLGWQLGETDQALAAFQRIVVDAPQSDASQRAAVALARARLRAREFGAAAEWLQGVVDSEADADLHAVALRELALRSLMRDLGRLAAHPPVLVSASTGIRNADAMATEPDGGVVLADRRGGLVVRLDATGRKRGEFQLDSPGAVACSASGRIYVAGPARIWRLDPERPPIDVGGQGEFAPAVAIAAEETGAIWLLGKKGEQIGRLAPGTAAPEVVWEARGAKLVGAAWDGRRLLTVDGRDGVLLAVTADGASRQLGSHAFQKPGFLAADASGTVAVVDLKAAAVVYLDAEGKRIDSFGYRAVGLNKPGPISLGLDGRLQLFEGSNVSWMRVP